MHLGEAPRSGLEPILCTNCGKHEHKYPFKECTFSRIARGHDSTCFNCKIEQKHLCTRCNECKTICMVVKPNTGFLDPT